MEESLKQKLANYRPSQATIDLIKVTPILLLVGPTGAGKDSLLQELLKTGKYHQLISHTTRQPRMNHGVLEQDGDDYHFIDLATAEMMLDEQKYVEAKQYSGNVYGVSAAEIALAHAQGKIAVNDLEVQGVAEFKKFSPDVMAVFLVPPDFETWQGRLQRRYGDVVDWADAKLRLQTALDEIEELLNTDYYMAMVNDDLDAAVREVRDITELHAHDPSLETLARDAARQLADDIRSYLSKNG